MPGLERLRIRRLIETVLRFLVSLLGAFIVFAPIGFVFIFVVFRMLPVPLLLLLIVPLFGVFLLPFWAFPISLEWLFLIELFLAISCLVISLLAPPVTALARIAAGGGVSFSLSFALILRIVFVLPLFVRVLMI